ncbi:MAG: hypothetical protein ACI376_00240 [Candidatus Bruticola sp.]
MIAVHLLCSVIIGFLWFWSGVFLDKIKSEFFLLLFRGCRGALLAVACCTFVAACVSHSGLVLTPDDSRTVMFIFFSMGLSLVFIPVGFLIGVAKGRSKELADEFKDNLASFKEPDNSPKPNGDNFQNYQYGSLGSAAGYEDPAAARASEAYRSASRK